MLLADDAGEEEDVLQLVAQNILGSFLLLASLVTYYHKLLTALALDRF